MARKPVFDTCMLCDEYPCTCKKPAKKAPAKRAKKAAAAPPVVEDVPTVEPEPTPSSPPPVDAPAPPRSDPRAAMRAAAGRARVVTPQRQAATPAAPAPKPARIVNYTPQTTGDPVIDDAIRVCGPILDPSEKSKYADLLWSYTDEMGRAAAWRNRRRELLNGKPS